MIMMFMLRVCNTSLSDGAECERTFGRVLLLTSAVRVMEVGVEAFFQPFGNFLYILLVNMLHKTLQISLKIQTRIGVRTFLTSSHDSSQFTRGVSGVP